MAFMPQPTEGAGNIMFRHSAVADSEVEDSSQELLAPVTEVREFFAETWIFGTLTSGYLRLLIVLVVNFSFCLGSTSM